MGASFSVAHAACLCYQLPVESRVARSLMTPEQLEAEQWTIPVRIAAMQLNALNVLKWQRTQDGFDGVNFPEPLLPPELRDAEPEKPDASEYKSALESLRGRIIESRRQEEGGA